MKTTGNHVIADVWLNEYMHSSEDIVKYVEKSLSVSKMTVLDCSTHDFGNGAITGVWLLSESHFSIHTFPERNYVSLDCYTCGDEGDPFACINSLLGCLDVQEASVRVLPRGVR